MFQSELQISSLTFTQDSMTVDLAVRCDFDRIVVSPKLTLVFQSGDQTRRLPCPIDSYTPDENGKTCRIQGKYSYHLPYLFLPQQPQNMTVQVQLQYGTHLVEQLPMTGSMSVQTQCYQAIQDANCLYIESNQSSFARRRFGKTKKEKILNSMYRLFCLLPVKQNRIAYFSSRRCDLTGNAEYVHQCLKEHSAYDFRYLLSDDPKAHLNLGFLLRFLWLYATSKVVLVDDFFRLFNYVQKRPTVTLIQLWHACGAFKTFGFSRLGKQGGPRQDTNNHRQYDYAVVSSANIANYYAEGFGLSDQQILSTGVPRTDIFMDDGYKQTVRQQFYKQYPALKGKKILLFAPTFRGNGQKSAHYPVDRLDLKALYESLDGEYAILVKLHPFCREHMEIPAQYSDQILDFSTHSELNDLLFVTDLLVTDYSSVVFEASILNIPMLFYVYDLQEYISSRDFYCEYHSFVPGKIVTSESALTTAIQTQDFQQEKVLPFRNQFFDDLDGQSSKRLADFIHKLMQS